MDPMLTDYENPRPAATQSTEGTRSIAANSDKTTVGHKYRLHHEV